MRRVIRSDCSNKRTVQLIGARSRHDVNVPLRCARIPARRWFEKNSTIESIGKTTPAIPDTPPVDGWDVMQKSCYPAVDLPVDLVGTSAINDRIRRRCIHRSRLNAIN